MSPTNGSRIPRNERSSASKEGTPVIELSISKVNEPEIVELILFLEALTVLVGRMLKIDPFDQPGVELGKTLAFQHLAKGK